LIGGAANTLDIPCPQTPVTVALPLFINTRPCCCCPWQPRGRALRTRVASTHSAADSDRRSTPGYIQLHLPVTVRQREYVPFFTFFTTTTNNDNNDNDNNNTNSWKGTRLSANIRQGSSPVNIVGRTILTILPVSSTGKNSYLKILGSAS